MTRSTGTPCAVNASALLPPAGRSAEILQFASMNGLCPALCMAFRNAIIPHHRKPQLALNRPAVPEVSGWGRACDSPVSRLRASPQKLNVYARDVLESDSMSTGQPGTKPVHRYIRNTITAGFDLSGTVRRSIGNAGPIHQERLLDTPGTAVSSESPEDNESPRYLAP